MQIDENDILGIINASITADEHPGDQSGGSGHMADVGYRFIHYRIDMTSESYIEITYFYSLTICSEFNVYPENPPREYFYKKTIRIDKKLNFETLSPKDFFTLSELPHSVSWPLIQKEITQFTELYLLRIEWKYGECRAPFRYPPLFSQSENTENTVYLCSIDCEDGDHPICCTTPDPVSLKNVVINTIIERFGDVGFNVDDEMLLPK